MPDVQHSALTTTELHEPKGIGSASAGTVYIADGAGSGAWGNDSAEDVAITDAGGFYTSDFVEGALQELGPAIALIAPKYGDMHMDENVTATTISTMDTYVKVAGVWTSDHGEGVTFANDELTVAAGSGGVYLISCHLSFTGQNGETFRFEFHKDVGAGDVPIGEGAISRKTSNVDVGSASLSGLVSLSATHSATLYVKNVGATGNPTITDVHFMIQRLKAE